MNSSPDITNGAMKNVSVDGRHRRFRMGMLSSDDSDVTTLAKREVWPDKDIGDMEFTQLNIPFVDIDVPRVRVN